MWAASVGCMWAASVPKAPQQLVDRTDGWVVSNSKETLKWLVTRRHPRNDLEAMFSLFIRLRRKSCRQAPAIVIFSNGHPHLGDAVRTPSTTWASYYRSNSTTLQCGPVVMALALRSGYPGFKTRSDHLLNLCLVVPGSTSRLHLLIHNWFGFEFSKCGYLYTKHEQKSL